MVTPYTDKDFDQFVNEVGVSGGDLAYAICYFQEMPTADREFFAAIRRAFPAARWAWDTDRRRILLHRTVEPSC